MPITKNQVFAGHSLSDHEKKNFSILELIRRNGPITRADISKTTDLNIVTVSNYINTYINENLVIESGMEASSGGRKPSLVKLRDDQGYAIGLDLGHMGDHDRRHYKSFRKGNNKDREEEGKRQHGQDH